MTILYLGDVMAEPGIRLIENKLASLKSRYKVDVVIAQSENVTGGKGLSVDDYRRLKKAGVDGFTGGNHSFQDASILPLLSDANSPVIAPANMRRCPPPKFKYVTVGQNRILIVSLLGQVVGRDANLVVDNPLTTIDEILQSQADEQRAATIVNFHGDYSSEKVVVGHYLDGRVTAAVGDHWHVPTADARVLPGGTAHVSDVGMCGALNSSLGVTYDSIIPRWKDGQTTKNEMATEPPYQLNGLLIEVGEKGLAKTAAAINMVFDK